MGTTAITLHTLGCPKRGTDGEEGASKPWSMHNIAYLERIEE